MPPPKTPAVAVIVMAHNEERRIDSCLASLPLERGDVKIHVVVNGSCDRTAAIARASAVTVHDWPQGGKARSWNRIVHDTPGVVGETFVFVDGDGILLPGAIDALVAALAAHPRANAAAGMPANGRRVEAYRRGVAASCGLFGDLYALRGSFVAKLRARAIRLPEDLVGDDSLIGALAKTDLANEDDWQDTRVIPCAAAGFLCQPTTLSPASLRNQYRRMISYSVRHFQNRIVSGIMRGPGPVALPRRLAELYPLELKGFEPRWNWQWWWFDRQALARMRAPRRS